MGPVRRHPRGTTKGKQISDQPVESHGSHGLPSRPCRFDPGHPTKATFLVTIESALLVYFMTMVGSSGTFDDFKNVPSWFAAMMASGGVVCLFVAIITVARVIAPRVSEVDLAAQFAEREPSTIAESLRRDRPLVGLSHQLRVTSETALKKDVLLATSVVQALYGFGLVIVATALVAVVDHFYLDVRF
jgi:hypothetical protein